MVQYICNIPSLLALNLLALANGLLGGIFDPIFEAQTDVVNRPDGF